MNHFSKIAAGAIFAATIATMSTTNTTSALAYSCKSFPTQAVGIRKRKMAARGASRVGWSNNVKTQFGLAWSVYKIAKQKSISCTYLQNIKKWRCLSSAKPCLYAVQ